jgi:hypothetical protein
MCGSLITKYNGLQVTGVGSYFIVWRRLCCKYSLCCLR